jgi:ABC-type multidrug transport system fused ATPase/permease subunit
VSNRVDPRVKEIYGRLWQYVVPHRVIGLIAVTAMATAALVDAAMVWLVEQLMDDTLVAHNHG